MSRFRRSVSVFTIFVLTGCTQANTDSFGFVARQNTDFSAQEAGPDVAALHEQTQHLDGMMRDLVRKSTRKGILTGAAVGCGLVVLSASNSQNCVAGAVAGGVAGGMIGHAKGKRDVARRVEIVSANALSKSIRATNDQIEDILIDLPASLAAQDIALADLSRQSDDGEIAPAVYLAKLEEVRAERRALAEALSLTEAQARAASQNLESAAANGQTGLEWHLSATRQMERDVASARSQITLF